MGMQLMIEALALTIFNAARVTNRAGAVRALRYFEKDEARHVGLGLQYLPTELPKSASGKKSGCWRFGCSCCWRRCWNSKRWNRTWGAGRRSAAGLSARDDQTSAGVRDALEEQGKAEPQEESLASRLLTASGELLFPDAQPGQSALLRYYRAAQKAMQTLPEGMPENVPTSSIDPEAEAQLPTSTVWRS